MPSWEDVYKRQTVNCCVVLVDNVFTLLAVRLNDEFLHLFYSQVKDGYKRQAMGLASDAVGQSGAVAVMTVGVVYLFFYMPVSYTHLDVYKRQSLQYAQKMAAERWETMPNTPSRDETSA